MKATRISGLLVGGALFSIAATAWGQTAPQDAPTLVKRSAALTMIGSGNEKYLGRSVVEDATNNDTNKRAGPGFEQSTMTHLIGPDGASYVVVLVMESVMKTGIGPYQISCSSFKMNEKSAPTMVAARKFLTNNKGERPANHPKLATIKMPDGLEYGAYVYGSQMGGDRTKTYFGITNANCDKLLPDMMISSTIDADNNDRGAPDIAAHGISGDAATVSFAYFSNGNEEALYMGLLEIRGTGGLFDVKSRYEPKMIMGPGDIIRPALASDGPDRAVVCGAIDGNRPAINVACARVDVTTGNTVFKGYVAKGVMDGDPYKRKYMGQPTIAKLADGQFAVQVLESNGAARNGNQRNLKGSNKAHLYQVSVNPGTEALTVKAQLDDAAVQATHAALCSGKFGVEGKQTLAVISAPPTGIGRGHMLMVHTDLNAQQPFTYDKKQDAWPINYNADSGYLANAYGENPFQQGRDFLRCIGDVPNPGHGKEGGYLPDVKSFWVAAIPGREVGTVKNSLYLSMLPAETDTPGTPGNPINAQDVPLTPPTTPKGDGPKDSGGCACTTTGGPTSGSLAGGLALLGVVFAGMRLRRRRK